MESRQLTDYERVGEERLRAIIDDFVARTTSDMMIGYLFRDVDPARLAKHEFQFTARAMGARIRYEGRSIGAAHAKHTIMGGQFARRSWLLRQTLVEHAVADDIVERLSAHMDRLRPLVTAQPDSACNSGSATGPLLVSWHPDEEV